MLQLFHKNMEIENYFKNLYFSKFNFTIKFLEDINLPSFKGSTFRGGFGYIFKKLACPIKRMSCLDCFIADSCPYANVFTNPTSIRNKTFLSDNSYSPHPFIFDLENDQQSGKNFYRKGEEFSFNFIVIGDANKYISYFIYSFIELGKSGIGKNLGKYKLISIKNNNIEIFDRENEKIIQENISIIDFNNLINYKNDLLKDIDSPDNSHNNNLEDNIKYKIALDFISPARIKNNKRYIDNLDFNIFIINILRRIYLLICLFCLNKNRDLQPELNLNEFLENSKKILNYDESLKWKDWERYSTRQKTSMKLGGFVGKISFVGLGNDFNKYILPILICEDLHVGKGTSFGLGKYKILNFKKVEN